MEKTKASAKKCCGKTLTTNIKGMVFEAQDRKVLHEFMNGFGKGSELAGSNQKILWDNERLQHALVEKVEKDEVEIIQD